MKTAFLAALASIAGLVASDSAVAAAPATAEVQRCATTNEHASAHLLNTLEQLHLESNVGAKAPKGKKAKKVATTFVDLYIHVVTTQASAGMVTADQITAQFNELNTAYAPAGFQFQLQNTSWTVNNAWAVNNNTAQMQAALRQGTYDALNIYLQSDMAGGILGVCSLPTDVGTNPTPSSYVTDGCQVALGSVPNGPIQGYNMGKTAVHETGHWLGLLHTFEGYSCTGPGDYVSDTPAESQSTSGCPTNPWKNTCGSVRAGVDPIHNYMDYSTDACYEKFTPGQITRMQTLFTQYRQGN